MTILTASVVQGEVPENTICVNGVRYGANADGEYTGVTTYATPVWHAKHEVTYFGATSTVTKLGDYEWRCEGYVGSSGWFYCDVNWFVDVVNPADFGGGHIWALVECLTSENNADNIGVTAGDPVGYTGYTPDLSDQIATGPPAIVQGEERWLEGGGAHTYQDGYFTIRVSGDYHTEQRVDATFRLKGLKWAGTTLWEYTLPGTINTSNVRLG